MISVNYVSVDIAKAKTEAIVNSLGTQTTVYGSICQSIVDATTGNGLRDFLQQKEGHARIGEIYETESFGLPCERILNIVTPVYHVDKDGVMLKKSIIAIFEYCLEHRIKSLTIPPLGAGANGYTRNFSYYTIVDTALEFTETHQKGTLDIQITLFEPRLNPRRNINRESEWLHTLRHSLSDYHNRHEMYGERWQRSKKSSFVHLETSCAPDIKSPSYKDPFELETSVSFDKCVDMGEENPEKISNLSDYISVFIKRKSSKYIGGDKAEIYKKSMFLFVGSYNHEKNGSNIVASYKTRPNMHPSNRLLFLIAMSLDMNVFEAKQLFTYHQAALSPINLEDLFFRKWLIVRDGEMRYGLQKHGELWVEIHKNYENILDKPLYPMKVGKKKPKKKDEDED